MVPKPVVEGGNFFTLAQVIEELESSGVRCDARIGDLVFSIDPGSGQVTCIESQMPIRTHRVEVEDIGQASRKP